MSGRVPMQQKMITKRCAKAEDVIDQIVETMIRVDRRYLRVEEGRTIVETMQADFRSLYPNKFSKP